MDTQRKIVIHSFKKNKLESIAISIQEYKQQWVCDVRTYLIKDADKSAFPTKKGICFSLKHLPEVLKGLQMVDEKVRETGLVPIENQKEAETVC